MTVRRGLDAHFNKWTELELDGHSRRRMSDLASARDVLRTRRALLMNCTKSATHFRSNLHLFENIRTFVARALRTVFISLSSITNFSFNVPITQLTQFD